MLPLLPMMFLIRLPTYLASNGEISGLCIAPVTRYAPASYVSSAYPSLAFVTSGFVGWYPRCFHSVSTAAEAFSRRPLVSGAAAPSLACGERPGTAVALREHVVELPDQPIHGDLARGSCRSVKACHHGERGAGRAAC